jgi:hypothetical protein
MSQTKKIAEKKKAASEEYKAKKGDWEYSFYQKVFDPNEEPNRKMQLKPSNVIDPNIFHLYVNPTLTNEENIFNKSKTSEKLSKKEKIILDNWLDKKDKAVKNDLENIKLLGLAARPDTNEGKTILILDTPVVIETINIRQLGVSAVRFNPCLKYADDSILVINMDRVITITEINDESESTSNPRVRLNSQDLYETPTKKVSQPLKESPSILKKLSCSSTQFILIEGSD